MDTLDASLLIPGPYMLAESPVWDERTERLYWTDINTCRVYSANAEGDDIQFDDFGQNVGCFALREAGGFVLALTTGLYLYSQDGNYEKIPSFMPNVRERFNDGKCDAQGRFWAGTMHLFPGERGVGALYCLCPNGKVTPVLSGLDTSNGLAFSEDGQTLYHIDTLTQAVRAYNMTVDPPSLRYRKDILKIPKASGSPDGMAIDCEGMLWIAHWGGGFVGRYDPVSGMLVTRVAVPVSRVTSCCFGGRDGKTLYITTASKGADKQKEPLAGGIFICRQNISGIPLPRFMG